RPPHGVSMRTVARTVRPSHLRATRNARQVSTKLGSGYWLPATGYRLLVPKTAVAHHAAARTTGAVDRKVGVAVGCEGERCRERQAGEYLRYRPGVIDAHQAPGVGRGALIGEHGHLHRVQSAVGTPLHVGSHSQFGGEVSQLAARRDRDDLRGTRREREPREQRDEWVAVLIEHYRGRYGVHLHSAAPVRVRQWPRDTGHQGDERGYDRR